MKISRLEIKSERFDIIHHATTSKGNQAKYTDGEIWIKTNYLGYEDLAEYVCSQLLSFSNITDFVKYELCTFDGQDGCYSENFLKPGERILTIGRILALYGITQMTIDRLPTTKARFDLVVNTVKEYASLDITEYLSNILAFDAIVMNEDRHIYNLAIIYCEATDTYRPCPIFDNGLSLMSDTYHYPEYTSPTINMRRIKCKPFNTSFKKQFEVCMPTIRFDKQQVMVFLETITNERIRKIIERGMQDYPVLFV